VCYALDGDTVVFQTDPGTKLHGAIRDAVAFEIDGVDGDRRGWSVLVVGRAELVGDAAGGTLDARRVGYASEPGRSRDA
jgi:hypothetical protein